MKPAPDSPAGEAIRQTAAQWVVRRERGLTPDEAAEWTRWLGAEARHAAAFHEAELAWSHLNAIPATLAHDTLRKAARHRWLRRGLVYTGSLAAAAALLFAAIGNWQRPVSAPPPAPAVTAAHEPRSLTLSDGTVVRLNTGGTLREAFTPGERHVFLSQGEAHFSVTKNPARPFIVHAGHIAVRAVGTAFNVSLRSAAVEVLVTEGVVKLSTDTGGPRASDTTARPLRLVNSGHLAVVALQPENPVPGVVVTAVSEADMARSLAWHEPLMPLRGATLDEIIAQLSQRTGRRIVLADPALGQLRLGGRVRSDDLAGFTALLSSTLELEVETAPDGHLILRKKNSNSR